MDGRIRRPANVLEPRRPELTGPEVTERRSSLAGIGSDHDRLWPANIRTPKSLLDTAKSDHDADLEVDHEPPRTSLHNRRSAVNRCISAGGGPERSKGVVASRPSQSDVCADNKTKKGFFGAKPRKRYLTRQNAVLRSKSKLRNAR